MKIAILSRDGTLYSCRRLREAAQQRGHRDRDPRSAFLLCERQPGGLVDPLQRASAAAI
ncbi:hypothetical protein ACHWUR_20740 [Klebsiella pneumoniae]